MSAVGAMAGMAAVTSSADAAGLTTSAPTCAVTQDAQAFLPWGDLSQYFQAPDGNFANSAASWSLSGGASAVTGGDGYSLGGAAPSTQSLALPSGSSATTPAICVSTGEPTMRFFAENSGSPTSTLSVSATVTTSLGASLTIPVGVVAGTSTWSLSPVEPLLESLLTVLPGNMTPVTLTFTPLGHGGSWQIDDVYVDPWTRGD